MKPETMTQTTLRMGILANTLRNTRSRGYTGADGHLTEEGNDFVDRTVEQLLVGYELAERDAHRRILMVAASALADHPAPFPRHEVAQAVADLLMATYEVAREGAAR